MILFLHIFYILYDRFVFHSSLSAFMHVRLNLYGDYCYSFRLLVRYSVSLLFLLLSLSFLLSVFSVAALSLTVSFVDTFI